MCFCIQELESAQEAFVHLLGQVKPECKLGFLDWVHSEYSYSSKTDQVEMNGELQEETAEPGIFVEILVWGVCRIASLIRFCYTGRLRGINLPTAVLQSSSGL